MALIVHFVPQGMTHEKYAEILRQLESAGVGSPPGRLHHTCYGEPGALRVTDVFDTEQNFDSFGKILVPILASLGVEVGRPEVFQIHNIIRS